MWSYHSLSCEIQTPSFIYSISTMKDSDCLRSLEINLENNEKNFLMLKNYLIFICLAFHFQILHVPLLTVSWLCHGIVFVNSIKNSSILNLDSHIILKKKTHNIIRCKKSVNIRMFSKLSHQGICWRQLDLRLQHEKEKKKKKENE